jgi:lipoyl-dependent peroxiredoxin
MKPIASRASVLWQGARRRRKGIVTAPEAGMNAALHGARGGFKPRASNPPELIAAAHAASFASTLANELAEAGYPPRQIETTALVTMESIAARWTLTQIHLEIVAAVPKVAECDFVDAALRAKANCPISRALNANISMQAKLKGDGLSARIKPGKARKRPTR